MALNLLLVEDEESYVDQYKAVLNDYIDERGREIKMERCKDIKEAKEKLNSSIDAVVVDLNLGRDTSQGEEVVDEIKEHFRIPVVILTGTPDDAPDDPPVIAVFTKGTHGFTQVLDRIWLPYEVGLTEIMGGRGLIEEQLNTIFLKNLLPTLDAWVNYGKDDPKRTKKALLRYALGHLMTSMEGDEKHYPEEFYLAPPLTDNLTTGSFVSKGEIRYIVMTPACDLVIRKDGKPKVDSVVLAEVIQEEDVYSTLTGNSKQNKNNLLKNNYKLCFHRLPKTEKVDGGYLDFRRLKTVPLCNNELECGFERLELQIAPSFLKDVVSRFSVFYARQGQPEVDPK